MQTQFMKEILKLINDSSVIFIKRDFKNEKGCILFQITEVSSFLIKRLEKYPKTWDRLSYQGSIYIRYYTNIVRTNEIIRISRKLSKCKFISESEWVVFNNTSCVKEIKKPKITYNSLIQGAGAPIFVLDDRAYNSNPVIEEGNKEMKVIESFKIDSFTFIKPNTNIEDAKLCFENLANQLLLIKAEKKRYKDVVGYKNIPSFVKVDFKKSIFEIKKAMKFLTENTVDG